MEIKKIFGAISNFIKNLIKPIRTAKWYQALGKTLRFFFWFFLIALPNNITNVSFVAPVIAIVVYGYIKAHGADKAKADVKAAADKAITKGKEMSK